MEKTTALIDFAIKHLKSAKKTIASWGDEVDTREFHDFHAEFSKNVHKITGMALKSILSEGKEKKSLTPYSYKKNMSYEAVAASYTLESIRAELKSRKVDFKEKDTVMELVKKIY